MKKTKTNLILFILGIIITINATILMALNTTSITFRIILWLIGISLILISKFKILRK